jgi:hypothetical protein
VSVIKTSRLMMRNETTAVIVKIGGTRWCSWLRYCATSRKATGSFPDDVTDIIFPAALWPTTFMCRLSRNLGASTSYDIMGLSRDCVLYCKNNRKCMHTPCEHNVEFRDVKTGVHIANPLTSWLCQGRFWLYAVENN